MSMKRQKKKGTTKERASQTKKTKRQALSVVAVEISSTSVLVDNKSLIIRSLLGKSA